MSYNNSEWIIFIKMPETLKSTANLTNKAIS